MSVRFEPNPNWRREAESSPATIQWFGKFARECLKRAQFLAAERIHGGTGAYQRGFRFEFHGGHPPQLKFGNIVKHAGFVEEGTVAHGPIYPVKKQALRWFDPPGGGEGAAVFASSVARIPAMPGKHIVRDSVREVGDSIRFER